MSESLHIVCPALDALTAEIEEKETLCGDDVNLIAAGCDAEKSPE